MWKNLINLYHVNINYIHEYLHEYLKLSLNGTLKKVRSSSLLIVCKHWNKFTPQWRRSHIFKLRYCYDS